MRTKEQHCDKVCGAAAEAALLKQAAVPNEEKHVEEQVETDRTKEEEVGKEPPHLLGQSERARPLGGRLPSGAALTGALGSRPGT